MKSRSLIVSSLVILPCLLLVNFAFAASQQIPAIQSSGLIVYPETVTPRMVKKALVLWGTSGDLSNDGSGNWGTDRVGWCAKFDLVSLDFQVTNVAAIHQRNPNVKVIGYKDLIAMKPDMPDWNEVNQHEDWFYHDIYGNRLQTDPDLWNWWLMDIRSQGWRQHFAEYINHFFSNHNFDGVFADDAWGQLNKNWFAWKYPASTIPDFPDWKQQMAEFLTYIKSQIGSKLLIYNGGSEYLPYADGRYSENFAFWSGYTPKRFVDDLYRDSATNKTIVAWPHYPFSLEGEDNFMFAFACYLLGINGPNAFFGWIDGWVQPSHGYYPEMEINPGSPLGPYRVENGLYIRDFQDLRVVVNMTAKTGQLLPPG